MDEQIENGYKIILVGISSVGKSSILLRYINNTFSDNLKTTIGVDHFEKTIETKKKKKINFSIWDTAGQERFRGLSSSYYKGARCVILVFDITNKKSFEKLDFYRDEIKNFGNKGVLILLAGNKSDMQNLRKVNREDIDDYCAKLGLFYSEVSALENGDRGIDKIFEYIAERIEDLEIESVDRVLVESVKRKNSRGIGIGAEDCIC